MRDRALRYYVPTRRPSCQLTYTDLQTLLEDMPTPFPLDLGETQARMRSLFYPGPGIPGANVQLLMTLHVFVENRLWG